VVSEPANESSLTALRIGGTEVHDYVFCPHKLWWFSHGMEQEHVHGSRGAEDVALGTLLHETSYPDRGRKNLLIDDLLRLDFTESGAVHEVKKSGEARKATRFQLLYYLYYLKREKGIETTGVIDYPKRRTPRVPGSDVNGGAGGRRELATPAQGLPLRATRGTGGGRLPRWPRSVPARG